MAPESITAPAGADEQALADALEAKHLDAEKRYGNFRYEKPEGVSTGKGFVALHRTDLFKAVVQIVKKGGGENNLHYHSRVDTFWMVLKGRVRFYGPNDVLIGEFGPNEGTVTPRFSRYWFESAGDEELELLQVAAYAPHAKDGGRTDVSAQRFVPGTGEFYSAAEKK